MYYENVSYFTKCVYGYVSFLITGQNLSVNICYEAKNKNIPYDSQIAASSLCYSDF
jgi:hypothetical protein